jgi:Flp pilus assembly protein TadG
MNLAIQRWRKILAATYLLRRDTEASALVEGAIVVPLLIVLLFGVYEFSWFFYQQHVISFGLRDAARYLARSHDACNINSLSWKEAESNAKTLATTGSMSGGPARVRGWTAAQIAISCNQIENSLPAQSANFYRGGSVIYIVTVATKFAEPSLGFFGLLGLRSPFISVAHSERVIGPG